MVVWDKDLWLCTIHIHVCVLIYIHICSLKDIANGAKYYRSIFLISSPFFFLKSLHFFFCWHKILTAIYIWSVGWAFLQVNEFTKTVLIMQATKQIGFWILTHTHTQFIFKYINIFLGIHMKINEIFIFFCEIKKKKRNCENELSKYCSCEFWTEVIFCAI